MPAGPGNVHVHDLAVALDRHGDVINKDAQQLLAVGARGRRGVPDPREIGGEGPDRVPLGGGQHGGYLLGEPLVLGFQPPGLGERGFPVCLELPGDEPVLRVGELVLAVGPVCGVAGAFDTLPPVLVQGGALVLGLRGGGHRDLQGRGSNRVEDPGGDVGVERGAGDVLAGAAGPVVRRVERARVPVGGAGGRVVVADRHAVPAAQAAAQQPGQQRLPVPRRARRLCRLPVGCQPRKVRLVLLLVEVGRKPPRKEHQPLVAALDYPPGVRAAGNLPAGIDLTAPEGVIARVGGVAQHVLQRFPGRAPPLQVALRRPRACPYRKLDLMLHEIAQYRVEGPEPAERAEDQADDVLRLLIRVEGGLP